MTDTQQPVETAPRTTAAKLADLADRYEAAAAAEQGAVDKQHARGKRSARERIEQLLDPGSFTELDAFVRHRSTNFGLDKKRIPGDGVVVGHGTVDGRPVCIYSQDFTVFGGSLGEVHGQKITKVMDLALRTGVPLIGISDGGGARIQEGVAGLTQFAEIFRRNVAASGRDPADQPDPGPVGGWRGVLPRADGLHRHGRRHVEHVHHGPRRHPRGHRRGRRVRGAGRRDDAQHALRRRALHGVRRGRRARLRALAC